MGDKEKAINGLKEDEIAKLKFLIDEATSKLFEAQEEIVLLKDKSLGLEKQLEVLNTEKNSITVEALSRLDTIESLKADKIALTEEIDKVQEESKSMEEILEGIEQKRQELDLEKQRLNENLNEVGANCEKRGEEIKEHINKIAELQAKLENQDELNHKLEFLQSQMEEIDNEKDKIRVELEKVLEERKVVCKENEVMQRSKIQELDLEKQRLNENLNEVGAN